ncbi:MAG: 2-C-methyl-D-erythritol 2,4-cyclodiphosphate synthase [Oscillospiraceae bacterium]|jgi:2-C-methyl-D-erythritol 2,4-cyclodiphosphate synthase|nr:2-C-methyl-D-erythritol 2,4-cyclodiphosphate synthase [Oscillospiraceae bacterium]
MRIGCGYDVHRMKAGRACVLCGVRIPGDTGPDGHSDADAPVHALADAILGAAALGDIGTHFPDCDARWKDADSIVLLETVWRKASALGYALGNADITIILERPRVAPYIARMRERIAGALNVGVDRVSVKATTEEGLGLTGGGLAVAASAVVLLEEAAR